MNEKISLTPQALVIDGEPSTRGLLRVLLEGNGYRFLEAASGQEGITQAARHLPDLVILDLDLPDMEGTLLLKRLREWTRVPILVVSARNRETDRIAALDSGADDYMGKPFSTGELLARLRAAQRHGMPAAENPVFRAGDLEVDRTARTVKHKGREVSLTPTEYSLLCLLVRYAGKVLTHQQILKEVWGPACLGQGNYLRVYMTHLRGKIEANPAQPRLITTQPGIGYRLHATA